MLKWNAEFLDRVRLTKVLQTNQPYGLEHFPSLISDRCLKGDIDVVARHARAGLLRGHATRYEVIPMPRGPSGDRPVIYPDLITRLAYAALVALADPVLDPSSRQERVRDDFRQFGSRKGQKAYVVITDIAACYEYIVPEILTEELFLRSDDYELAYHLSILLNELSLLGRGIPQMLEPSDRLSDLYLSRVDRALDRAGLRWCRTADDYKIVVSTWDETTPALELLEKEVRALGLILSADKTRRVTAGQRAVTQGSGTFDFDFDIEKEENDDDALDILIEWHASWKASKKTARLIDPPPASAIWGLSSTRRLSSELLADLAFAHPPHLEHVVELILRLAGDSTADEGIICDTFNKILATGYKNAWARLWLLNGADRLLEIGEFRDYIDARDFAISALDDNREAVRTEAAWLLARRYALTPEQLRKLHLGSSDLTMAGVCACAAMAAARAGRGRRSSLNQLLGGVLGKEPINELAATWARSQV